MKTLKSKKKLFKMTYLTAWRVEKVHKIWTLLNRADTQPKIKTVFNQEISEEKYLFVKHHADFYLLSTVEFSFIIRGGVM